MTLLFEALLWLHIVGAIGWIGTSMVFGMVLGPALPSLSPPTRGEFVVKVLPRIFRFASVFVIVTPLIGLALALSLSSPTFNAFDPTTQFGRFITAGALLSIAAWFIFFGIAAPTARKVVRLTQEMVNSQGPPSPDLPRLNARMRMAGGAGLFVMLAILVCMVGA